MSYTGRKYNQNSHSGARNSDVLGINTSADWCRFDMPEFSVSGATKIQSVTSASTGVYITTGETEIDLTFSFSGDLTTSLSADNATAIAEFYKYDTSYSGFVEPRVYTSEGISYSAVSATSAYTITVPLSSVTEDNEYLIKTYFEFNACTEFLNDLDVTYNNKLLTGDLYAIYDSNFDYYISVSTKAATPIFGASSGDSEVSYGNLVAYTLFPSVDGQTVFTTQSVLGQIMVNVNGVTLSSSEYSLSSTANSITISAGTYTTDVVTLVHAIGDPNFNGLVQDTISIDSAITSGATDGQGSNDVYYNTTQSKYELYTSASIIENSDVIVTLNGITLANNIDYYKSISNNRRVILNGVVYENDLINIFYYTNATYFGGIYTNTPIIAWNITPAPQRVDGLFTLELSTGNTFTTTTFTSTTDYVVGQTEYSDNMTVSGTVGTTYYYRVKNEKSYAPISGGPINSIAHSEVIPLVVQTNSINSY